MLKKLTELEQQAQQSQTIVWIDHDKHTIDIPAVDNTVIHYKPLPTAIQFHEDSTSLVRFIMGPFGSGKSSMCIAEMVFRASQMPVCIDGIRRYRAAIIRNTMGELETTTLRTWLNWCTYLGSMESRQKPVMTYQHNFYDQRGRIELELMFIGLDKIKDVGKLKSLELTDAYINESSEIPKLVFDVLTGRINRYPNRNLLNDPYSGRVIMDSNPPDTDHWLYQTFEEIAPERYRIFKQPPGLLEDLSPNPDAENIQNLGVTYYVDMAVGKTREFIIVFCMGKYGCVIKDKPVYPQYNDDLHAVDDIAIDKKEGIYIGWDFGLTPACLIVQYVNGQIRCIKEFVTERSYVRELATEIVKPWLNSFCTGLPIIASLGDPSGVSGKETDGDNCINILNDIGICTIPARTNVIETRIDSVADSLNKLFNGRPSLVVSKHATKGCPSLVKGFRGSYHYQRVQVIGQDKFKDIPNKIHPFSDIHDCLQYICMQIHQNITVADTPDLSKQFLAEQEKATKLRNNSLGL